MHKNAEMNKWIADLQGAFQLHVQVKKQTGCNLEHSFADFSSDKYSK